MFNRFVARHLNVFAWIRVGCRRSNILRFNHIYVNPGDVPGVLLDLDLGSSWIDLVEHELGILVQPVSLRARVIIAKPSERGRRCIQVREFGRYGEVAFVHAVRVNADRTGGVFGYGIT
ncbi:hypothetical protein D3C81_1191380 [compost metagenome]